MEISHEAILPSSSSASSASSASSSFSTSQTTETPKIGDHVAIYWELDQKYYSAVVLAANQVKYLADSVIETVDFTIEKYQMLQAPSHM
mgnify:CR=1 FL=1